MPEKNCLRERIDGHNPQKNDSKIASWDRRESRTRGDDPKGFHQSCHPSSRGTNHNIQPHVILSMNIRMCVAVVVMFAVFGVRTHAEGQIKTSDQPSEKASEAASKQPPDDASSLSELRAKRDQAQRELDGVSRPNQLSTGAPPGTPEPELLERRTLLHHIVRSADEQIDATLRLEQARQHRDEVGRSLPDSKDHGDTPATIFDADRLWDTAFALRLAVEGLQSQLALIELRSTRAKDALQAAEERLRQASEHLESTTSS